ncbi:MAG: hypothetical protein GTN82_38990 [Candidatus Aminicenantes bacterium]|nr:hypothetical protein [Candidatus Aminicenantes bacterium]NIR11441.1 hypothetical protein [Candidatus Aminicenantes bacterium]
MQGIEKELEELRLMEEELRKADKSLKWEIPLLLIVLILLYFLVITTLQEI